MLGSTSRAAPTARTLMRRWRLTLAPEVSVSTAAGLLAAAGVAAAPVVGPGGRCVGVFTAADHRRWLSGAAPVIDVFSEGQMVAASDRVCDHMTRLFATAAPEAGVPELLRRLGAAADPFLVVLDRLSRPQGFVCALDAVAAADSRGLAAGGRASYPEA